MHSTDRHACRRVPEWHPAHVGFLTRTGSIRGLDCKQENTCVMAQPRSSSVGATSSYAQHQRRWSRQRKLGEKRGHYVRNGDIHIETADHYANCTKMQNDLMRTNTVCEEVPQKSSRSMLALKVVAFMKRKVSALGSKSRFNSGSFDLDEEWSWKSMSKQTDNDATVNRVSNVYDTLSNKRSLPSPPLIRPPPPLPPSVPVRPKPPIRRQTIAGNCAPAIAGPRIPQTAEVKLVRIIKLDKILKNKWISGIAVTKKNEYLIVDLKEAHLIDEFGNIKRTIGSKGLKRLQEPIDATVMASGNIAVSDHAAREVKVYNCKGQFIHSIRDDSLCNIAGVAANAHDNIVIAGTDKQRISVFGNCGGGASIASGANGGGGAAVVAAAAASGGGVGSSDDTWKLLCAIPPPSDEQASSQRAMFDHPYSVAVNPLTEHVIVGDDYRQLVTAVCVETGRVLWRFTPPGDRNRHFFPSSICVDNDGYVFVADLYNEKVYMLDSSGKYLKAILSRGDGLKGGPGAIAVDGRGHLIVADEEKMLKIFKYGENGFALYRRFSYCPNVV